VAAARQHARRTFTPRVVIEALESGARNTLVGGPGLRLAGIVIGVITLTGLGIASPSVVLALAQNSLLLALVLTDAGRHRAGHGHADDAGLHRAGGAAGAGPRQAGRDGPAAHLFALYFAVLSAITPPVALAVYAANGLSGAGLMDSSWAAVKLGLTGYIIPFMFVFAPALLLIGEPLQVALAVATSVIGVVCLAGSLHEHFFLGTARPWERVLLFVAALVLIKPGWATDLLGLGLIMLTLASQHWLRRPPPAGETA
jgi:TRAP-type uncharacterized transport system fused permease subunit